MRTSPAILATVSVTCLTLFGHSSSAEDLGWDYRLTLYGWFAGFDTSIETPRGTVESEVSINDVLSNLDMALMTAFEARRGRWGFLADLVYADITMSEDNLPGGAFSKVSVEPKLTTLTGLAAYRIHETTGFSADLGIGLRYVNLDTEVRLQPGDLPGGTFGNDEDWVDPVVGVRFAVDFNEDWYGRAYADVGTSGGDSSTWQASAVVGYSINPGWGIEFGYRHMQLENSINGNDLSLDLSGPMIGVSARF